MNVSPPSGLPSALLLVTLCFWGWKKQLKAPPVSPLLLTPLLGNWKPPSIGAGGQPHLYTAAPEICKRMWMQNKILQLKTLNMTSLMNYQAYCCYIGNTNILTYITFIFETYFFSLTLLISSDIKKLSLSFLPFRHPAELR